MELLCGLDEAGRGPLAGPVSAGAVVLPDDFPVEYLNDSKKLSAKQRTVAEKIIKDNACWGIGFVDHTVIDRINILQASLYAMRFAFEMMMVKLPEWLKTRGIKAECVSVRAIADGNFCPSICIPCTCEPKADAKYHSVMAASIIAKTGRDRLMIEYDAIYPGYNYAQHKGYPTLEHKRICREKGPSPIQRLTFKY